MIWEQEAKLNSLKVIYDIQVILVIADYGFQTTVFSIFLKSINASCERTV